MEGYPRHLGPPEDRLWQKGLCVLLAVLILYNPFIALYSSHGAYSVHTPQRNRATVGASELQHFRLIQKEIQEVDASVEKNLDDVAAPSGVYAARGFAREEVVRQPEFLPKVWSRPPPSL